MSLILILIVFLLMLAEAGLSSANERALRAQGAIEPDDDVYWTMAWAYPASFVVMGLEGWFGAPPRRIVMAAGFAIFALAKTVKYWAIASLGVRWTFRVLVLPHAPLVTKGPYRWLRHPNYVGVVGELLGVALVVGAPITGALAVIGFGWLIRRRIVIENRALGRDQHVAKGV